VKTLTALALAALLSAGCAASHKSTISGQRDPTAHGGSGIVSAVGKVGPLTLGLATAAAVERFAGRPDFIGAGSYLGPKENFTALSYDCSRKSPQGAQAYLRIDRPPSHVYCRTVYYINSKTRRFGAFWTSSPRFRTLYGTHPGSSQSYANAHEDTLALDGCHTGLDRSTGAAELVMDNRGGKGGKPRIVNGVFVGTTLIGGVINDFELETAPPNGGHEASSWVGLLFC
jgi:hypothetical protein